MTMTNQSTATTEPLLPLTETLTDWRYAVYFEGLALWRERDPQLRANIAKQLAEWSTILADLEAAEAKAHAEGRQH